MPTRRQLADALRVLAIDAIEQAGSGHPGAPMGMADMAEALWRHGFRHSPEDPQWVDRDRFVLSNGHASMLLYGLLHLTGYDLPMQEIRDFRQLGSRTPGHPEYGCTPGVDMTTGPLGQGIASAVGMALAERMLAWTFNRPDHTIVDHYTYCFCGDGCLMEGVSAEACSLAGTFHLGRLIVLYDANGISIDGSVDGWFTEDVKKRYESYDWQVIGPLDGHDPDLLDQALSDARKETGRPTLVICRTHIGYGSPKEDSASSHGAPLGADAVRVARESYGWDSPPFEIPDEIREAWDFRAEGRRLHEAWQTEMEAYRAAYPAEAQEFERRMRGDLPAAFEDTFRTLLDGLMKSTGDLATRKASQKCLEAFTAILPEMVGGSADLTGSVGTRTSHAETLDPTTYSGSFIAYGVREFGMDCIMNGMALHGGFLPFAGTFLSFSDQGKNALRLAAIMKTHDVFVFTHDSIGVGEDGPTHQPVEQIAALRMTPGLTVFRPCDTVETAYAWKYAIEHRGPTALILSRQTLPGQERTCDTDLILRGGYVLLDAEDGRPDCIIIATGSEVALARAAWTTLTAEGRRVRVVSMPCTELFDAQDAAYRESVLPKAVRRRLAIEAGATDFWWKYVGLDGQVLGMSTFGLSAPAATVFAHFGFTPGHVVELVRQL